jgi:hypothetical protein
MGKPPGPMLDDYAASVSEGAVWVLEERAVIAAIIVLLPAPNYLLLDNLAVSPARQGLGLGRQASAARVRTSALENRRATGGRSSEHAVEAIVWSDWLSLASSDGDHRGGAAYLSDSIDDFPVNGH